MFSLLCSGALIKQTVVKLSLSAVCLLTESQLRVRFDIWEQGNVSPLQLSDKLQGALRHALCDVVMELRVLPNPLCLGVSCPATKAQREEVKGEYVHSCCLMDFSFVEQFDISSRKG